MKLNTKTTKMLEQLTREYVINFETKTWPMWSDYNILIIQNRRL